MIFSTVPCRVTLGFSGMACLFGVLIYGKSSDRTFLFRRCRGLCNNALFEASTHYCPVVKGAGLPRTGGGQG
jgi:hypothetical protein